LLKNEKVKFFGAIPLPTRIQKFKGKESSTIRTHKRLIRVVDANPHLIEKLTLISIPQSVDIDFKTKSRG
jgi:ribosomal protein S10